MIISPYRTSVTAAMQDKGKRVDPDTTNRKSTKCAKHHKGGADAKSNG